MRLGKTQKQIVAFLESCGEEGGYVFSAPRSGYLKGHDIEEVERSLAALEKRGIVVKLSSARHALSDEAIARHRIERTHDSDAAGGQVVPTWLPLDTMTTPPTGRYVVGHRGHSKIIHYLNGSDREWSIEAKIGWQIDPFAFLATHYFALPELAAAPSPQETK